VNSAKSFAFDVAEGRTPQDILERARTEARGAGIALHGDAQGGRFEGTATGTWAVDGRTLRVEVQRKPTLVPWGLVESLLKRVFG
jgi:hypothetical protein